VEDGTVSAAEIGRTVRTVAPLRPGQAAARARLRAQRAALERGLPLAGRWLLAGPDPAAGTGWPAGFIPLDARAGQAWPGGTDPRGGEISLLGVTRTVAPPGADGTANWPAARWEMPGEPLLWRFHLHYWDWAWPLAAEAQPARARAAFATLWDSWRAAITPGRGPAWHPYPAALRAWSLCGLYQPLARGGPADEPLRRDLSAHAGFLRRHLETDVGGNHLIKNLKALAGLAVFFGDDALLARALRRLGRQLRVQVLPDGGHYERAPAYHCQVLGDLIDISGLLRAAGQGEPALLAEAIAAMRGWLGAVLTPDGDVPLLNDGFPVSPDRLVCLDPAPPPSGPVHLLPATGLARAAAGGWHLLADIGLPCPRQLPAHAHADTLAFVAHLDGAPLLIDTGTSSYAPGPVRDRERSTAAHNTVEVDGRDSTEVWGAFRAGRRARVHGARARMDAQAVTIEAAHDGYRHLPGHPAHHRRWSLRSPEPTAPEPTGSEPTGPEPTGPEITSLEPNEPRRTGSERIRPEPTVPQPSWPGRCWPERCWPELCVEDTVTGRGRHRVTVRWHLAPDVLLRLTPGAAVVTAKGGELTVTVTASDAATGGGPLAGGRPALAPVLTAATAQAGVGLGRTTTVPVLACDLECELPVRIVTRWRRAESRQEQR
jgi:hypothetical protein